MRKLAVILVLVLCGCENDFNPLVPGTKTVPVVYGFMDTNDSIHTIRLTKTFYGTESAYEMAKDSSNLLYDSVNLFIECMNLNDTKVIDTLTFHKTYFTPPANGIFNTGRSWYYVSTDTFPSIDSSESCRLRGYIYDSGDSIGSPIVYTYSKRDRIRVESPTKLSNYFSVYSTSDATRLDFEGLRPCQVKIRFNYFDVSNNVKTEKSTEKVWSIIPKQDFKISPAKLFMFIRNGIPENPDVDYRKFESLDIWVYGGPNDVLDMYNRLFTTDRDLFVEVGFSDTPYPDIINGYGMFYGYTKDSVTGLKFDDKTLDSLAAGQYTKNLKFVPYQ